MHRKITSTHSPPDTPFTGSGLPRIDQNRISISRRTPQPISRNGQYIEMMSTIGNCDHKFLSRNSTPITIRISGPTTDPLRVMTDFLPVGHSLHTAPAAEPLPVPATSAIRTR